MTQPTQAQIEAGAKAICIGRGIEPVDSSDGSPNWWMFGKDAEAALTAVAQVGEHGGVDHDDGHGWERMVKATELATIERCAQVAIDETKGGHLASVGLAIAAAIRKLKDAP